MTEVETKRIVLAFESWIPEEVTWAINTLAIFSCNSTIPFTLDSQPFLLDSLCSYLTFAVKHCPGLWAFTYHNLIQKLENKVESSVPTITESAKPLSTSLQISYRAQTSFSEWIKQWEQRAMELRVVK